MDGATTTRTDRWEGRLYAGLRVQAVPADARSNLARALGALGVEAEHFLAVVDEFTRRSARPAGAREEGERFLWQLEASARRLAAEAQPFEVAAQAYLAALEAHYPELIGGAAADVWWPAVPTAQPPGAPLELALRERGFAYRHVVAAHVANNVEEIAEALGLLLHALRTLPPAGVLPVSTLYGGIYALAAQFQGHLVPHHLGDLSAETPGLLSGLQRLRALDAAEDRSVAADLAWAREQLEEVRRAAPAPPTPARGGLAGLFRRPARGPAGGAAAWAARVEREWRETIAALEALPADAAAPGPRPAR
jgi:hypothetical protein